MRLYHTVICNPAEGVRGALYSRVGIPGSRELLHTLTNWRKEILNYFDYSITNDFVEGKNNHIKTIKRMAYGYRLVAMFYTGHSGYCCCPRRTGWGDLSCLSNTE